VERGVAEKVQILDVLGQHALLLPELVSRALAANDRVKVALSMLQAARAHADAPDAPVLDLSAERRATGLDDPSLDGLVREARRAPGDGYAIPRARLLATRAVACVDEMLRPLELARDDGVLDAQPDPMRRRLTALAEHVAATDEDRMSPATLALLLRGRRGEGEGLHGLVMDAHAALNQLQAAIATETLHGARVHGLQPSDRPLVAAFMEGVAATAPLAFGHPGLGTTATRAGGSLLVQNDIGTTDAHVIVVRVDGLRAVTTYTDIHVRRLQFFQDLFEPFAVTWADTRSQKASGLPESDSFYTCTGTYQAADEATLARYLRFLGSRLVFLIDWNRARKQLGRFVGKREAVKLLAWAAAQDLGHRAFLALGGESLVNEAIEFAARPPLRYGQRLDDVLGRDRSVAYLRFLLRASSEGLAQGRSDRLVRDEAKAELLNDFLTAQEGLVALAGRQARLVFELASVVHESLLRAGGPGAAELLEREALRAAAWERKADALVNVARAAAARSPGAATHVRLLETVDDAADDLEEAAHLLTLVPAGSGTESCFRPLARLGAIVVGSAQELVKCLDAAGHVHRLGAREDRHDFLEAVDRIVTLEHDADVAQRAVTATLLEAAADFRTFHVASEVARCLEQATDAVAHAALFLRDQVLGELQVR
jgi:uncharacterized protein Yka (UPF0111/DUF47 family)